MAMARPRRRWPIFENIDNVVATIGNDVIKGNANANTFTYTAADGTHDGQAPAMVSTSTMAGRATRPAT